MSHPTAPGPPAGELLALMLRSLTDYAVFFTDTSGTILTWAPGVKSVLGYEPDDFIGRPLSFLFTEADCRAGAPERELTMARTAGQSGDDRWHVRRDGSEVFVFGALTALRSDAGELVGFAKIVRDRTEHRELLRQLDRERERAEKANDEKDTFMAVLAHELHRPLNAIRGWAQMAVQGDRSRDEILVALHRIMRSGDTMIRLVNDLLDISRVVAGKLHLAAARVDLGAVIDHAIAEADAAAHEKQIAIVVEKSARPHVMGDQHRLTQVVSNLLSNGIKYTPPGGRVVVTLDAVATVARLTVADTGQGLSAEQLPYLFQRFGQLPGDAALQTGLGLGLWVSHELVRAHHGTISVESPGLGKGATFVITLPLAA